MKILHITPQMPGQSSGGMLCIRQTLLSLIQNGYEVDYVGPEIEDMEIKGLYSNLYELSPNHNRIVRLYDTLFMNTNQRYRAWLELKLDYTEYDSIVMDFTKLNYVLKGIPAEKLIVRVHNVEKDYSRNNFIHHKNIFNFFDFLFAGSREKQIVRVASKLLVLTNKDKMRLQALYNVPEQKMVLIPVCIEEHSRQKGKKLSGSTINMLITGSLWYGSNYEGIKWFLNKVYPYLTFEKHLTIAGARPNSELLNIIDKDSSVELIDTPKEMEPYFQKSDVSVVPVFDGAGMKVKVAEALSYGLPVVGTSHAFEGYDIVEGVNAYRADTPEVFIQKLNQYAQLPDLKRSEMSNKSYSLFKNRYSQECSCRLFKKVIENEV